MSGCVPFLDAYHQFSGVYVIKDLPLNLVDLLTSCNMLLRPITDNIMARYISGRSSRDSTETVEEINNSSTQQTSVGGGKKINKFKYSSMSELSRPIFLSFDFDENALEKLVQSKFLTARQDTTFIILMTDLTLKLTHLRSIIYSIKWVDDVSSAAVWSENRIQCIMELFLNYTLKAWYGDPTTIEATAANAPVIENLIEFTVTNPDGIEVTWKGYSDLKCCHPGSPNICDAVATVEMKVPFANSDPRLFHSKALQPKQQLLGQAIGLLQASSFDHTLSYLTDIFAISVMYHIQGKAYLSKRVTDAKAFCLRLLLMCCEISSSEWDSLLSAGMGTVDLDDDLTTLSEQTHDMELSGASSSCLSNFKSNNQAAGPTIRSKAARNRGDGHQKTTKGIVACGTIGCEEEEAHQRRLADITNVRRWEARCFGNRYLDFDELQKHNNDTTL
jgi:hypothetical protein